MVAKSPRHSPADLQELTQIVSSAHASRTSLEVVGGGSKLHVGFPNRNTTVVSTTRFDRIVDYDPSELVMTVGAAVRLTTIQTLLEEHGQMLAFEPFDFATIAGGALGESTIGGVVAAGFAGSRRLSAGNVRDHVLGFTAVSGRGESFVAGGRVVKNVTGYDLSKLMCGSWGQLAILTELTFKVLPRPREALTLRLSGLDVAEAYVAMTRAVRSQSDVAAAAYFPSGLLDDRSHVLLRLEGFGPSVEARAQNIVDVLAPVSSEVQRVSEEEGALWSAIPQALLHEFDDGSDVLWRICSPSTQGVRVCTELNELDGQYCLDWGGGLIWAKVSSNVAANQIRRIAQATGGHATMLRAPRDYRTSVSALHPEAPGVAALTQRVKHSFDPLSILDPQRFAALS